MKFFSDPRMKPFWDRLVEDFRHPFTERPIVEPGLDPVNRTGFEDFTHAIKNVFVEYRKL